jgi:hypothetical protein
MPPCVCAHVRLQERTIDLPYRSWRLRPIFDPADLDDDDAMAEVSGLVGICPAHIDTVAVSMAVLLRVYALPMATCG